MCGRCPLIIGTAAEFGLNVFVRYPGGRRHRGAHARAEHRAWPSFLNGLTTMAGFASLMVAHHQGIFGLDCS